MTKPPRPPSITYVTLRQPPKRRGGFSNPRRFAAPENTACTNCDNGIDAGQMVTWAWGGHCHLNCVHRPVKKATLELFSEHYDRDGQPRNQE